MERRKLMGRCVLAVVLAFALPFVFLRGGQAALPDPAAGEAELALSRGESASGEEHGGDGDILLRVLTPEGVQSMSMAEYLPMALAGEMPASFHPEALKAQAVALRSYILHHCSEPKQAHPEADVCGNSACCAAALDREAMEEAWGERFGEYYAALCRAAEESSGEYLAWEGEAILAVFHSCSMGFTEAGENLWVDRPYLLSVSSPETGEDVSGLVTRVEISSGEFLATLRRSFPALEPRGGAEGWVEDVSLNSAGRVESVTVAGQEISGLALRQMFSLRSTAFTLDYEAGRDCFLFTVAGYGHGLGMSQYGAHVMACSGAGYREILEHYYPGAQLCRGDEETGP